MHVFDISQIEGEPPLADLDAVKPTLLDGTAPAGIWDALVAQANDAGFEVIRDRKGSENGYCDFFAKTIAVRPDVSRHRLLVARRSDAASRNCRVPASSDRAQALED